MAITMTQISYEQGIRDVREWLKIALSISCEDDVQSSIQEIADRIGVDISGHPSTVCPEWTVSKVCSYAATTLARISPWGLGDEWDKTVETATRWLGRI